MNLVQPPDADSIFPDLLNPDILVITHACLFHSSGFLLPRDLCRGDLLTALVSTAS